MQKLFVFMCALGCALLSTACTIKQEVQPLINIPEKSICIVEDKSVREGFLQTLKNTLSDNGYQVRVITQAQKSSPDCELTATYHGLWSWDLAIYLSYARIEAYRGDKLIGKAEYDARRGGGNMGKFVNGEKKIRELTEQLFNLPSSTPPVTSEPMP